MPTLSASSPVSLVRKGQARTKQGEVMSTGDYIVMVGQRIQRAENTGDREETLRLAIRLERLSSQNQPQANGEVVMRFKTYRAYSMRLNGAARHGSAAFWPSDEWTRTEMTFKGRNQQEALRKAERFWARAAFGGFVEVREEANSND